MAHAFHRREITLGKIQVVGGQPVAAKILRLPFHGFAGGERGRNELFDGFLDFTTRHRQGFYFFDFGKNGATGGIILVAIHDRTDAK